MSPPRSHSHSRCNVHWKSQWSFIKDLSNSSSESISIKDYLQNARLQNDVAQNKKQLVCPHGHAICLCVNRESFVHVNIHDVDDSDMSSWHARWQSYFPYTETKHDKTDSSVKNRYADATIGNTVLEFQHSVISRTEVCARNHDYELHGKNVLWIVDGNFDVSIKRLEFSKTYLITFHEAAHWKFEAFMDCKYVYLSAYDYVYRFEPSKVKSCMIDVIQRKKESAFVSDLLNGSNSWDETELSQCTLYYNQRGAGCGKTYESIQLMSNSERFENKKTFIYLTKIHAAKDVIYEEFRSQYSDGKLLNMLDCDDQLCGKQYKILFKHKRSGNDCTAIIGTVDSFIYALGDKEQEKSIDFFKTLLDSIKSGYKAYTKEGGFKYASGTTLLNKDCLVIIDEAQDLDVSYIQAVVEIMRGTYIDVYVIGDKLQSIWGEDNVYTYLENNDLPNTKTVKDIGANVVRRFHNSQFISFVNGVIDFKKYNLPSITGICSGGGCCKYDHDDDKTPYKLFLHKSDPNLKENAISHSIIKKVISYMKKEIYDNHYLPHNFMFIFPFMKNNTLANMLESKLRKFWIKYFEDEDYQNEVLKHDPYWKDKIDDGLYYKYVVLHKSEDSKPINMKESEYATKMLSIHASKGQGCEVVFLLNMTEKALQVYSKQSQLVYDSLLHVAITRQKKSIYIGIDNNNDDIYRRFAQHIETIELQKAQLDKYTNHSNIDVIFTHALQHNFKPLSNTFFDKYLTKVQTDSKHGDVIDWGHHMLRYDVAKYMLFFCIFNNRKKGDHCINQIYRIIENVADIPIKVLKFNEYYETLRGIANRRYQAQQTDDDTRCIPILKYKTKSASSYVIKYVECLTDIIKHIKFKITRDRAMGRLPNLCPIEMTIIMHIVDVLQNGIYAKSGINAIYDLLDTFHKSSQTLRNHEEHDCKCMEKLCSINQTNASGMNIYINEEGNSLSNSIVNHYEIVTSIKRKYRKFMKHIDTVLNDNSKFTFNISHYICFSGTNDEFLLGDTAPIIANSSKNVIIFQICTSFNNLKCYEIMARALFDSYIVKQTKNNTKNFERFDGKNIYVCLFTLDACDPIWFEFDFSNNDSIEIMNTSIKEAVFAKYSEFNQLVYEVFEDCKKNKEPGKTSFDTFWYRLQEYLRIPKYIRDFFTIKEAESKQVRKLTITCKEDLDMYLRSCIDDWIYGSNIDI